MTGAGAATGCHHISEASIQRYGRQLRHIERIRVATREATAIRESTPDDGQLADATIRLLQVAIHDAAQKLGEDADEPAVLAAIRHDLRALASAGRAVADLARASRAVRDERRLTTAEAAAQAGAAARAAGVSPEVEAAIRRQIEGTSAPINSD